MPWIPDEEMTMLHIIRQDVARATKTYEESPSEYNEALLFEAVDRRTQAINELHNSGEGFTVKFISAMMRCNKQIVRDAINNG
jgi:hypothetical protein